jgi:tetratricopeptide (TPR) repeat protein
MRVASAILVLCGFLAACGSAPPQSGIDARRERLTELNDSGQRAVARGDLRRAAAHYTEALRLAEAIEDFRSTAINALNLAATWQALDEIELCHRALDKVLAFPARFEQRFVSEAAGRKALLAVQAGQLDAAQDWLNRAEGDCQAPACGIHTALLNVRGQLLLERGATGDARAAFAQARAASQAEGNREEEANALRLDGRAATRSGEHAQAMALLGQALEIDKQLALPRKIAQDLLALAEAELARGARAAARDYAQRAYDVSRAAGSRLQQNAAQRLLEATP